MSIWTRLAELVGALAARGEGLAAVFDRRPAAPEKSVAFTIAVICLGAKMAKADGAVKPSEVAAFRQVFQIAPEDEAAAARVFNLARQDVAGFEVYAGRIARMFRRQPRMLEDIVEGLFHVAVADGDYNREEESFLRRVAEIFGLPEAAFDCVAARIGAGARDPWRVLGLARDAGLPAARARWRKLVRENHPDRLVARGLPEESVALANARLAAINAAWREIAAREIRPAPAA
jgi:DnaJ like chaperone protein